MGCVEWNQIGMLDQELGFWSLIKIGAKSVSHTRKNPQTTTKRTPKPHRNKKPKTTNTSKSILEGAGNFQTGKMMWTKVKNILYSARKILVDRHRNTIKDKFWTKAVHQNLKCPGPAYRGIWGARAWTCFLDDLLIYSAISPVQNHCLWGFPSVFNELFIKQDSINIFWEYMVDTL